MKRLLALIFALALLMTPVAAYADDGGSYARPPMTSQAEGDINTR